MDTVIDGASLRRLRRARGLTVRGLAAAAGIDSSVVSRAERNVQKDLSVSALIALALALDTPAETLLRARTDRERAPVVGELAVEVLALGEMTPQQQRGAAALLRTYRQIVADSGEPPAPERHEEADEV